SRRRHTRCLSDWSSDVCSSDLLGDAPPRNIIVLPVLFEGEVLAVIELASFNAFSQIHQTFLDQLMESIGVVLNMIQANMRTEELDRKSTRLNSSHLGISYAVFC